VVIGARVSPINRTPGIAESILLRSDTEMPVIDWLRLRRDGSLHISACRYRGYAEDIREDESERGRVNSVEGSE